MEELTELRKNIDKIDEEIVRLFKQRMWISSQIAAYKNAHDLPIFVPERETEKLTALKGRVTPELEPYLEALYSTVFRLSRQYQEVQK